MKRTQPGVVLRAGFAQLDVLAHNADDVSLLLDGARKIAGTRHWILVCSKETRDAARFAWELWISCAFQVEIGGARRVYRPCPTIKIGEVGLSEPASFSNVTARALATTPSGSGWSIITALPCSSGLNIPAGMGAPCDGMIHNSYALPDGTGARLLAISIKRLCPGL